MKMETLPRRTFIKKGVVAGAGAVLIPGLLHGAASVRQKESVLKGKKVLFSWGGWKGHQPEQCKDLFVPWLKEEGADVIVTDTLDTYLDTELMKSLDLIVPTWTMSTIDGKQAKGLLDNEGLSVTDIAFECGFSSSQYFNRMFKQSTERTPLEYRRSLA